MILAIWNWKFLIPSRVLLSEGQGYFTPYSGCENVFSMWFSPYLLCLRVPAPSSGLAIYYSPYGCL